MWCYYWHILFFNLKRIFCHGGCRMLVGMHLILYRVNCLYSVQFILIDKNNVWFILFHNVSNVITPSYIYITRAVPNVPALILNDIASRVFNFFETYSVHLIYTIIDNIWKL